MCEACHLFGESVVSTRDLDNNVTSGLGRPRRAVVCLRVTTLEGRVGGIEVFLEKLAPMVKDIWRRGMDRGFRHEVRGKKERTLKGVLEMQKECFDGDVDLPVIVDTIYKGEKNYGVMTKNRSIIPV